MDAASDNALISWANVHLAKRGRSVASVPTAFADGVNLLLLLDVLNSDSGSATPIGKVNLQPKLEVHRCQLALLIWNAICRHRSAGLAQSRKLSAWVRLHR